jgi:hypothetical protein
MKQRKRRTCKRFFTKDQRQKAKREAQKRRYEKKKKEILISKKNRYEKEKEKILEKAKEAAKRGYEKKKHEKLLASLPEKFIELKKEQSEMLLTIEEILKENRQLKDYFKYGKKPEFEKV